VVAQPPWIARITSCLACEESNRELSCTVKKECSGTTARFSPELGTFVIGWQSTCWYGWVGEIAGLWDCPGIAVDRIGPGGPAEEQVRERMIVK
jgi:hypothetical protein